MSAPESTPKRRTFSDPRKTVVRRIPEPAGTHGILGNPLTESRPWENRSKPLDLSFFQRTRREGN